MRKQTLGLLVVLMVLAAPMMTGAALASKTVQFNGAAADSADQTNTTYIATGSTLDNFTVQMTEDQNPTAGGSIVYNTNVTASSASIASGTDTGNLTVTVNSGNITISDSTGADSDETVTALNVTFNVTDNSSKVGVNVSYDNWMKNDTTLIEDPDSSEVHTYLVYAADKVLDVTPEFVGGDIEFNSTSQELEANGSDNTGQLVFHLTRNNSTYESIPLSAHQFRVALNTTYFSHINDETSYSSSTLTLSDKKSQNGETIYVVNIVNPNNTTESYAFKVNATVEAGDANGSMTYSSIQNPDGGVESQGDTTYDHAIASGTVAPNFFDVGNLGLAGLGIGIVVVVGIVYFLTQYRDPALGARGYAAYGGGWVMWAWVLALLLGLSMVMDYLDLGFTFDLWSNLLVTNFGLPSLTPIVGGLSLIVVALGLNVQNSTPFPR